MNKNKNLNYNQKKQYLTNIFLKKKQFKLKKKKKLLFKNLK